jgi:trimeric autotransporter adhesin
MSCSARSTAVTASALLLLAAGGLSAQAAHQGNDSLSALAFASARFKPAPAIVPFEAAQTSLTADMRAGWADFLAMSPVRWQAYIDRRTGHLESAVGGGIAWLPGRGNSLKGPEANLANLEAIARAALPRIAPMLGVDVASLALNPGRSGRQSDNLWYADFDVRLASMTVEGARVVFRVSNGNLVEIGGESLPSPAAAVPAARVSREQALAALSDYVHGFSAADFFSDSGSLHLLPADLADPHFSEGFEPGNGRGLALIWEIVFRRRGVTGTWRARIDAESGQVLELLDVNLYGRVTGGVFPLSPATTPETVLPMPFADVDTNTPLLRVGYTDSAGFFTLSSSAGYYSSLSGQYVFIVETCPNGQISKESDFANNISFGTSAGTDCATPVGQYASDFSTHSARTQFYHVNRIKEVGRVWLPGNAWLGGDLRVNVNRGDDVCNAYWDGTALNFYKSGTDKSSGTDCNNNGEIAGVSMHEYGHGLDWNDGSGISPDQGTAETYGDFTSTLMTHSSCVGLGFYVSKNCGDLYGYGDPCTSCTGLRDIDYAKHSSATPATVANFTQSHCDVRPDYPGPCGREGHCESYVSSEALWDFVARDLPSPGSAAAWAIVERLWYLSRATATGAFTCDTVPAIWTSSGCATGSLWRTLRAVDDDDGDLTNGTPHGAALFAAFNRHGIACASDPGAGVTFVGCTPPAVPTLSLTAATPGQVQVSWTSSGAGILYDVYRSELGCSSGFVRVADSVATSPYIDTAVSSGFTYSYQVVAHPAANSSCAAAPTSCQSAIPLAPTCSPPAAPMGLAVTNFSVSRIDLSWPAVGGAEGPNLYRATSIGGPYTLIATLPGANLHYDVRLSGNTTYYYKIRSYANGCESADSNVVTATTATCKPVTLYKTDFETGSGLAGWTTQNLAGGSTSNDWRGIQACSPTRSGSQIFRFGGSTCSGTYGTSEAVQAAPPAVAVPAGAGLTKMSFWHRRDFEANHDGGIVMAAFDGGAFWEESGSGEIYDNNIADPVKGGPCLPTFRCYPVFSGTKSTMANTVVVFDEDCDNIFHQGGSGGCGGHSVQPGFLAVSDSSPGNGAGWFLDDIEITTCVPMSAMDFYTITPCRLIDTRSPAGPLGGPTPPAGASRTFTVTGACSIPSSAQALSINLTVVATGSAGYLQVYPGGSATPAVSAINFVQGQTLANNGLITLAFDGTGTITVRSGASGPVNFVIDVNGYYQ